MPTYKAPVEDVLFLLADVFQVGRYDNLPGFADASARCGSNGLKSVKSE